MTEKEKKDTYHHILNCMILHNITYGKAQTVTMSEDTKQKLLEEIQGRGFQKYTMIESCKEIFGMKIIINNNITNGTFVVGGIIKDRDGEEK